LESLPLEDCNDDFVFDNEMLALACYKDFKIGEVSCPTKYFPDASSEAAGINTSETECLPRRLP
jgi:hypothetical protein